MDYTSLVSVGLAACGLTGGVIYGYGRLSARVDAMEQRHTGDIVDITKKLETKIDREQFANLHADVREIREMVLQLLQRHV